MGENNNNFKEKFQAFWNVKRNKIATIAGGSVLGVGIVLAIALPIALNDSPNSDNTSGGGTNSSIVPSSLTDEEKKKLGILPVFEGDTVTYGLYPQTHVKDDATIAALNGLKSDKSNGWYLYNGEYYANLTATPCSYSESQVFDDGATIESNASYWFKCEPIKWNIIANNDNTYTLLSSVLLCTHTYDKSSNNYINSEIRGWLNDGFYNTAFKLDSSLIQTTTVDNSASTTDDPSNVHVGDGSNTEDKVYLLSFQDYQNADYGFKTVRWEASRDRECKATDYASANGVWNKTGSAYSYSGYYWTRSPASDTNDGSWFVYPDGSMTGSLDVDFPYVGVRPAITIKYSA